jgi:hypothetical protein
MMATVFWCKSMWLTASSYWAKATSYALRRGFPFIIERPPVRWVAIVDDRYV